MFSLSNHLHSNDILLCIEDFNNLDQGQQTMAGRLDFTYHLFL